MVELREFAMLGRLMRMEDMAEVGENTLGKLKEAIERGDRKLALALADYLSVEAKAPHDAFRDWAWDDVDWIARNYGEEEVPKALRHAKEVLDKSIFARYAKLTVEDLVKWYAEVMRGHRCGPTEVGDVTITEEPDRYVMEFKPCGTGGRMILGPLDGSGSRAEPPYNLGKTSRPYTWSWSKAGVPYYCTHCCVWHEIMGIESRGYPFKITEFSPDDATSCYWYFYKDPDLIPAEYFERVGFKKDPSKFRR